MSQTDTKFVREGNTYQVVGARNPNETPVLPPGNYVLKLSPRIGFYLEIADNFTPPPKIYGNILPRAKRIISTFMSRPAQTGVLLTGEKGSGKTLLARTICAEAAATEGIPTIIINAAYTGDAFFTFIASIHQAVILLFDEFEKVYAQPVDGNGRKMDGGAQNDILTLLDGVFQTKKMCLLTCNDKFGINTNMINRPGRIYYALEFSGLEESFIRDYATDNLKESLRHYAEGVVRITHMFSDFNFDMLKALIEEMNRYDEKPAEAMAMLNVSPLYDYTTYNTEIVMANGRKADVVNPHVVRNPIAQKGGFDMTAYLKNPHYNEDDDNEEAEHLEFPMSFGPRDIESTSRGELTFKNRDGHTLRLSKKREKSMAWGSFTDSLTSL